MTLRGRAALSALLVAALGPLAAQAAEPLPALDSALLTLAAFSADSAGGGTVYDVPSRKIFLQPRPDLPASATAKFEQGQDIFEQGWTPAFEFNSVDGAGLGPLFNADACETCHRNGGRGPAHTRLLRLSIPPQTPEQQAAIDDGLIKEIGDPTYGIQFQENAVSGLTNEGMKRITVTELPVTLGDGTVVALKQPTYIVHALRYGPMHEQVMTSPRLGPQLIGLGLLEAVPAASIEALADPLDRDGDGISGRPNYAHDPVSGQVMLGRFGWKAGNATLRAQAAAAFLNDIGISTGLHQSAQGDCTGAQAACLRLAAFGSDTVATEAPDAVMGWLTQFLTSLGVPARRDAGAEQVLAGQQVFTAVGCDGCHTPALVIADAGTADNAGERIWPYTDLLLHDMGEGLADHRPEGMASGFEWRTPPLWGLGLADLVMGGKAAYLHDGRAGSVTEAVLWHGGEAQAARDGFAALPADQREALLAFLNSL